MKLMTIQVPDDSVEFVEEFVERIGGSVEEPIQSKEEKKGKKKAAQEAQVKKTAAKKKKEKIDHTYLFDKWKDFDIDARKIREQAW